MNRFAFTEPSTGGDHPRFSIFIPVWNSAEWLSRSIQSVLDQEYEQWELIIGDNASTDDTESIVAGYSDGRIRYHLWNSHTDIYENFNRTLSFCQNEWVIPSGADDQFHAGMLKAMAERICLERARGDRLAAVATAARRVDPHGNLADIRYYGTSGRRNMADGHYDASQWLIEASKPGLPPWNIGSIAISKEVLLEMGSFFRPEIGLCADHELILRVAAHGCISYIAEALFDYTTRDESDANIRTQEDLASGEPIPSVAAALLSGLRTHEYRREVPTSERKLVHKTVANSCLRRAVQHRFRPGGRGRSGTLRDLLSAFKYRPMLLLSPLHLLFALAVLTAPSGLIAQAVLRSPRTSWLKQSLRAVLPQPQTTP